MKRIEFTITDENGELFREPGFLEDCSEVPLAVMRAVEDYLEAHHGKLHLPIVIRVHPHAGSPSC